MINFQFSIFNKFSKKPLLRLAFVSIVCVTLGVVVGLVLNYQTLKKLRSEDIEPAPPVVVEEKEEEKIATYSGTIKPAGKLYPQATHYLENENGEMILLLESPKIDLGLIEGWEVEVEGTVENTEEGRLLMEVSEVRL